MNIMKKMLVTGAALFVLCSGQAMAMTNLRVLAAGTLALPFRQIDAEFHRQYPNIQVEPVFGGSVKMAKMVTELHEPADIVASADYSVIPKYLYAHGTSPAYTNWYIGFVGNEITFTYTPKSKGASKINASNWYKVMAEPGVEIGRSSPNTDPSGYQIIQMLNLANSYYHDPKLEQSVLANAPQSNMRDTETDLISALQVGQIDYLAIYRSDAIQHHFEYLHLPDQINLSNARYSANYAKGKAVTKNGVVTGRPIIYALTIIKGAAHTPAAEKYVAFLLGPKGRKIMKQDGFIVMSRAYAANRQHVPQPLQKLTQAWPGK
ncbi:MAG: extracellular solute-binding protein [Pseudomonadota bacterium]|nr:extracellular solute-binding protein [Pseudomonadota bacterium]